MCGFFRAVFVWRDFFRWIALFICKPFSQRWLDEFSNFYRIVAEKVLGRTRKILRPVRWPIYRILKFFSLISPKVSQKPTILHLAGFSGIPDNRWATKVFLERLQTFLVTILWNFVNQSSNLWEKVFQLNQVCYSYKKIFPPVLGPEITLLNQRIWLVDKIWDNSRFQTTGLILMIAHFRTFGPII